MALKRNKSIFFPYAYFDDVLLVVIYYNDEGHINSMLSLFLAYLPFFWNLYDCFDICNENELSNQITWKNAFTSLGGDGGGICSMWQWHGRGNLTPGTNMSTSLCPPASIKTCPWISMPRTMAFVFCTWQK